MNYTVRFSQFNASLNRNTAGQLVTDLSTPNNLQAKAVAEIIQRNNSDVLLINEFDYSTQAVNLFKQNYLEISQNGALPVTYPYFFIAPSNTGIASGFDLNNNGTAVTTLGTTGYGDDALGFGNFPGQYGMLLLSKYPIDTANVRTFQNFLWKDMPGNLLTNDPSVDNLATIVNENLNGFYSPQEINILRLSSKSHWDVPIQINEKTIHVLVSHPTPPTFDGTEDRNGKRNSDEIRFWADYITTGKGDYIYDDNGKRGSLPAGSSFVIMGDQNADPSDGDSYNNAISQLLLNPSVNTNVIPSSLGAPQQAILQGGANTNQKGNPVYDTADFADSAPGNLRADYVLPSSDLQVTNSGVYWPSNTDANFPLVGTFNASLPGGFPSSDHRLIFADVQVGATEAGKSVVSVGFKGQQIFNTGFIPSGAAGTLNGQQVALGGLSGVTYDAVNNRYYAISDDRSSNARFYTFTLDPVTNAVTFTNVVQLKDINGNAFATNSLDPEGIALTSRDTVLISSEGEVRPDLGANRVTNPFIKEFNLTTGQEIRSLAVPNKFNPVVQDTNGNGVVDSFDTQTSGVRNNLAFESLTITPDQKTLFTATESALFQDGAISTTTTGSRSRIIQYNLVTGQPEKEYLYITDPIAKAPIGGTAADNGLVDLLAIDNRGTLLALERSFAVGQGNTIKIYEITLQSATDISTINSLSSLTPDQLTAIQPAQKRLLLNLDSLGLPNSDGNHPTGTDNIEGLAFGPRLADGKQSIVLVSDNNFFPTQFTQIITLSADIVPTVTPIVETRPALLDDGSLPFSQRADADDPAIYVNATDSSKSLVLTSVKNGGLRIYDLAGNLLQTINPSSPDVRYNNIDLQYGFTLGGEKIDVAVASDRHNDKLAIFKINPQSTSGNFLENITDSSAATIFQALPFTAPYSPSTRSAYGLALYRSPLTNDYYVFTSRRQTGDVAQLKLVNRGNGKIGYDLVREFTIPSSTTAGATPQTEGMVVDQETGFLYIGQEDVGIWKFNAEPNGSSVGRLIEKVKAEGGANLTNDVEGLTIYYGKDGTGYLLASSQGDNTFAVYTREGNNNFLGRFGVGNNGGIDSVQESDGADVINLPLGPNFPLGLFVTQDGSNDPATIVNGENISSNFKLVPWENIANALPNALQIDTTSYDPRNPVLQSRLTNYQFTNLPKLGTTVKGQDIFLGGFSGLYFQGMAANGNLQFVTHTDRGPNGDPNGANRPFYLPDFQPEIVSFELNQQTGAIAITKRTGLFEKDGTTPLTGLPNLQAGGNGTAYTDEIAVDLNGQVIPNKALGADLEGIVIAPNGDYWLVDEYRPGIYHFDVNGKLLERFIPQGTAIAPATDAAPGTFGTEVLPAVYAQRRNNRGFEAVALEGSKLYAFIQSAIDNPDNANDTTSRNSRNLRILEFDIVSEQVTGEYLYLLDNITGSGNAKADKIGDAVSLGNGKFAVVERDDLGTSASNKLIYEINLAEATNINNPANFTLPAGKTIEQLTLSELTTARITPVSKNLIVNAAQLGYTGVEKLEGLALVAPNTLALINDNDFNVSGNTPIQQLGILELAGDAALTAINSIASGDTTQTSTVLWAQGIFPGEVKFEYSTSSDFSNIIGTRTANVGDVSLPVKVSINGLTPNTNYFYRVTDITGASSIGKFSTAATLGNKTGLKFGVSGDWRGELAPYPAINNADEANLKFFIALGDTIYADVRSPGVKNPDGSEKSQATTLGDYRAKQSEVYGSKYGVNTWGDLRASTSILATIDDHEVINDFAGGALVSQDDRFVGAFPNDNLNALINDSTLYENGLRAFQEYNPISDQFYGQTGDVRTEGERKLYRYNTFGGDAATFVLDARSFRDVGLTDVTNFNDQTQIANFLNQSFDSSRTMLGRVQLADLKRDLLQSQRNNTTWKFIIVPEPIQNLGVAIASDRFEGYAAERTEILKFINDNKITNVVFVTADFHGTLVNNLTYQTGPGTAQIPTGAWEIITGSVAYDQPFGQTVANFFLNSGQRAFYNSLPIANDADSVLNDKDDFIKQVVNGGINALGYDPIGLNDNLAVANGLINANLLQGDYIATHTYGWTEFNIDQVTQKLTVTTYGIDAYSRGELEANPSNIVSRQPRIVSQFEVDPHPKLSINDVKVVEGLDRKAFVTVVLSGGGSSQTVKVNYSTSDGTAREGTNYTGLSLGVITFNPGETTKTISVAIADNSVVETDRNFTVSLSNPVGVAIADGSATVTITDTFVATESTVLAPGVENLTLTGTANINGTGNSNNNTITGNSGNNTLNGGTGKDTLIGGVGNDTYIVDNILDVVTEALNGGTDLIQSSVTYTLSDNVENLTLTGTANINGTGNSLNNTITGNNGNNTLNGGLGTDTLIGGVGNDTYVVDNTGDVITEAEAQGTDLVQSSVTYTLSDNVERLTLTGGDNINATGNSLNNTLTGNSGNNTLDGGLGTDTLMGGAGNDTYIVDSTTDTITDSAGTDTIQSSVNLSLVSYATIENLNLTGTALIGTGNSLNNTITGNSGDNTLNGGAGNDSLVGGTGNDTYLFSITTTSLGADTITEAVGGGQDTIDLTGTTAAIRLNLGITTAQTLVANGSKLTLTAANAIENVIAGAGADRIIGNDLDNLLVGGAGNDALTGGIGNDTLVGGAGNDALIGGAGNDVFSFAGNAVFTVVSQGLDTIQDFTPGNDQISLSKSVFASVTSVIGQGFSVAEEFATVEDDDLVGTSNGLIVYSSSSGSLFYNQNGTAAGFGNGGEFAILATAPTLTASNFSLV